MILGHAPRDGEQAVAQRLFGHLPVGGGDGGKEIGGAHAGHVRRLRRRRLHGRVAGLGRWEASGQPKDSPQKQAQAGAQAQRKLKAAARARRVQRRGDVAFVDFSQKMKKLLRFHSSIPSSFKQVRSLPRRRCSTVVTRLCDHPSQSASSATESSRQ